MTHNRKKVFKGALCQPLDPHDQYEVFCSQLFSKEDIIVTLRPLSTPVDDPVLKEIALSEMPGIKEKEEILFTSKKDAWLALAGSDFGNIFLGLVNNEPAFIVTIHHMKQHALDYDHSFTEGDYMMILQILPIAVPDLPDTELAQMLQSACTTCFLEFPEIERLIDPPIK